jgi:hypothetical protein
MNWLPYLRWAEFSLGLVPSNLKSQAVWRSVIRAMSTMR